jgi:branched-chain amino acid transport system ATP-binding protein
VSRLKVKNLEVRYGDLVGVSDVSLKVEQGTIVALLGANGAGKTTTLNAIAGLVPASQGTIEWDGAPIANLAAYAIVPRGLTLSPEGWRLFVGQTVEQNLLLGATPLADKARVPDLLERVLTLFPHLAERRRQRAGTLSGGERQMLAMAMALMVEPRVLLLDEPSAGLAPALQRLVFDRIREINARGLGILLVEQNARESLALCRRAYVLAMGRVRAEGPGEVLRDDPEIRRLYLGG